MPENRSSIISGKLFGIFAVAELLILIALKLTENLGNPLIADELLMFSAILLNALFMLFLVTRVKRAGKDLMLLGIPLAVFTTLLADCFLVLLHGLSDSEIIHFISPLQANMIGFFVFGIVQVVYACHLGLTRRRILIRVGFYLAFIVAIAYAGLLTLDHFIACLSMSQLILNLVFVWIEHAKKRTRASLLLAVGISLFFGCDTFIMMRILLPQDGFLYTAICFMVWVFYIPSQVVLTSCYYVDRTSA